MITALVFYAAFFLSSCDKPTTPELIYNKLPPTTTKAFMSPFEPLQCQWYSA